jgi:circadian clock protein KaiB
MNREAPGNGIARKVRYRLRLYIAGRGTYASRAEQGLANAAVEAGFDYDLEVIDLCLEPDRALADRVVVTPTLIRLSPLPRAIVIGDLSDRQRILDVLRPLH